MDLFLQQQMSLVSHLVIIITTSNAARFFIILINLLHILYLDILDW